MNHVSCSILRSVRSFNGRAAISAAALVVAIGAMSGAAWAAEDLVRPNRGETPRATSTPAAQREKQPAPQPAKSLPEVSRIGVIDLERVARDSLYFQSLVRDLEMEVGRLAEDVELKVQEIRRLEEQFERQRSILAADEAKKQEEELRARRDEVDLLNLKARRLARSTEDAVIEPALLEVLELTRELAQKKGFDLVLRADLVLFVSERSDLTEDVIAALDARLPKEKREAALKAREQAKSRRAAAAEGAATPAPPTSDERGTAP